MQLSSKGLNIFAEGKKIYIFLPKAKNLNVFVWPLTPGSQDVNCSHNLGFAKFITLDSITGS